MLAQTIMLEGKAYVVLPRDEFDRLSTLAKAGELPPLPEPDAQGNYPAVEYARASLARKIIRDRVAAGLSQREVWPPGPESESKPSAGLKPASTSPACRPWTSLTGR